MAAPSSAHCTGLRVSVLVSVSASLSSTGLAKLAVRQMSLMSERAGEGEEHNLLHKRAAEWRLRVGQGTFADCRFCYTTEARACGAGLAVR